MPQHLLKHWAICAVQDELVTVLAQSEPAVTVHRVGHIQEQGMWHRITAVGDEGVDDLLGVVACSTGVPQAQRSQPIGVHVFGCTF